MALAAGLKCDPDLVFEYVYNNIAYEPLFGSNKGALGTLLDQRGSDLDQARLLTALLIAAGVPSSQISYQYGYVRLTGAQATGWLGVKNDGLAIRQLLINGGIPIGTTAIFQDGTLFWIDVSHVWVRLEINGTQYVFDPSFKQHTISPGLANLGAILGYTQSQFLANAGGVIDGVSISNLNRTNIRNNLVSYANSLINYITSNNPAWAMNDVVGGKTIQYLAGSPRRLTSLPYISPSQPSGFPQSWGATVPNGYRTCFTISMPGVTPTQCSAPSSQTIQLYSDETYGRRITVFSVPSGNSYIPTLMIDGSPPSNGQNTGTSLPLGGAWPVNVSITHPYASAINNQNKNLNITSGGSYLISAGWGQVGRGMIQHHRTLLDRARATGAAPESEAVLGETLAIIGYTWLAESAAQHQLTDAIAKITTQYHHGVGIVGQARIQNTSSQGPYVDLPLNVISLQPQTNYTGTGFAPSVVGAFFSASGVSSSLESAVLEQTQALVAGVEAASTVRLVDNNASTSAKTYFADGTSAAGVQAYFSSIRPNISGYSASDLNSIDCAISSNCNAAGQPTGTQVLMPANGHISVGLWHGAGYSIIAQTQTSIAITQRISGGLSGGFTGVPIQSYQVVEAVAQLLVSNGWSADMAIQAASSQYRSSGVYISDPVDGVTGAYTYQHSDMVTGSGAFPHALTFARTYTSSASTVDIGLGKGWAHNYNITVSRTSDPFSGLGANSPISAAAAIVALYVTQDLLSGSTKSAQNLTVAWVVTRWLTDQLTNNSVGVSLPGNGEQFIKLPGADGSPTATYNPPLGYAAVLTGSAPDRYGNYTVFTYRNKDQSQLTFNALDPATLTGNIASWTFPNGVSLGFAYGYSHSNTSYLTAVTNNLGRRLTLAYSGAHLTTVTDDTGRTIAFGYDASDRLVSFTNPLQQVTSFAYEPTANRLTQVFYPSNPGVAFVTNTYDAMGHVVQQADANGNNSYLYFAASRSETVDPAGARHVTYQSPRGKITKDIWVLDSGVGTIFSDASQQNGQVNVSAGQYDGQDRLVLSTAPEGGTVAYTYSTDLKHNVVQVTQTAKPGSPLPPLVTSYSYDAIFNKPTSIIDPRGLVTAMTYDPFTGNLLSILRDAGTAPHFNAKTTFTYNGSGQVLTATDPMGTVTLAGYDSFGNQTSITRDYGTGRLNQISTRTYSALGDAVSATDPNGNLTTSTYDMARRVTAVTSPPVLPAAPNGVVTSLSYDADDRVVQTQQSANGVVLRTTSTTYTSSGKPATATDANGNVTAYAYDAVDRLSGVTDAVGRVTSYAYDAVGRRTKLFNTAIQAAPLLQQGYTPNGALASLTDANGNATSFAYDGFDRLATTTYPGGSTEAFTYDADGNVLTRKTRANATIAFTYDTLNRLSTKTPPSPAPVATYAYDLAGRLTSVSDTSAAIYPAQPPSGPSVQYATSISYDSLNRPAGVSFEPAPAVTPPATGANVTFAHSYNKANQRTGQTVTDNAWWSYPTGPPSTVSYTANALNQYTAVGAVTPTYDNNGNLTSDGTFTFGYDAENRLVAASGPGVTATYAYDAQGRRKSKTVNGATTVFVTDADNREVLEYDGSNGQVLRWYAYGLGTNDVLGQMNVPGNTRLTFIPDQLGSIIGVLDGAGGLTKVGYAPYGRSAATTAFAYTGQRIDPETNGLHYYRARMYASGWGRFVQPDPIGFQDGTNLYVYVGNDPINLIDPLGLSRDSPQGSSTLASGAVAIPGAGTAGEILAGGSRIAVLAVGAVTGAVAAAILMATTTSTADRSRDEVQNVVRGGITTPQSLIDRSAEHIAVPGLYGFSVQSAPGLSVEQLARAGGFPNRQISVTTTAALAELGIAVVPSPGAGYHATAQVPNPFPPGLAAQISGIFRQQPNPILPTR